jgi:hypothetical protein
MLLQASSTFPIASSASTRNSSRNLIFYSVHRRDDCAKSSKRSEIISQYFLIQSCGPHLISVADTLFRRVDDEAVPRPLPCIAAIGIDLDVALKPQKDLLGMLAASPWAVKGPHWPPTAQERARLTNKKVPLLPSRANGGTIAARNLLKSFTPRGVLVPRGGIEPPTRGFSIQHFFPFY